MLNQDEQIALFVDAIDKNALKMRREIEKETKHLYAEEAQQLEQAAQMQMEEKLCYAENQLMTEFNRKAAADKSALRHELYKKRETLTARVFEKAEKKLCSFAASSEYAAFLERSIKSITSYLGSDFTLYVKPGDCASVKKALSEVGVCCEVIENKKIRIGGVIAECLSKGKVIDDTLDERLSEQREWFLSYAGSELNV